MKPRDLTVDEILNRWNVDPDVDEHRVRVLKYVTGLEERYARLLQTLEDITNHVNDLNMVVPDEHTIEQINDIQNKY